MPTPVPASDMPTSLTGDILASGLIQGAFAWALESANRHRASHFSTRQPRQTKAGSQVLRDVTRHMLTWLVMRAAVYRRGIPAPIRRETPERSNTRPSDPIQNRPQ